MERRDCETSSRQPAGLAIAGLLLSVPLVLTYGCTKGGTGAPAPNTTAEAASTDTTSPAGDDADQTPAVLEGRVLFKGKVPEPRKIVANKDVEFCGKFDGPRPEVVVSESGGLDGVVIEIRGIAEPAGGWKWKVPKGGYALFQEKCAFYPPLLVMPSGQEVHVFNNDPVSHNVNTGVWNVLQAADDDKPLVRTLSGQRPIRVGCNIHSWMESWIYFVQSPYYAVTDENGDYSIEGIPPGEYRLLAWHPSLRQKRMPVALLPGEDVEEEIVFESPY